jgi:hypothetical protein
VELCSVAVDDSSCVDSLDACSEDVASALENELLPSVELSPVGVDWDRLDSVEICSVEVAPGEVLSAEVLCSVVLGSCEVDCVELSPRELGPVEIPADELASIEVVTRDVDSDEIDSVELDSKLLVSAELDSMDVVPEVSDDADDSVDSAELEVSVADAMVLRELEEGSSLTELDKDKVSELAGRELVAPGDCVSVVMDRVEVVRISLVELSVGWLRLSDSLLSLLVCSSEDAEDVGLLTSEVLASEVETLSLVLSVPRDELDSVILL